MTGLAPSTRAIEPSNDGFSRDPQPPAPTAQVRRGPRWLSPIGGWPGIGLLICGVGGCLPIVWYLFLGPGEIGSKAEWFFGAVVFCVVLVSMWQTASIQRHANQAAAEAAERSRRELAVADERSARELTHVRTLHRAELEAQQELARIERSHLLMQLQKQAVIEVSRAVGVHTQLLATLWNQGASILRIEEREARELAMTPIFEQISQTVNDFSIELANAHLLVEDDRVHHALDRVNEAALLAIRIAEDVHLAVVDGRALQPNPVPPVQRVMQTRAAEARSLAWDLVRTALNNSQLT